MKFKKERPSINKNHKITFPKVTLCLNSMHSKQALEEFPSEMEENYNLRSAYIMNPLMNPPWLKNCMIKLVKVPKCSLNTIILVEKL